MRAFIAVELDDTLKDRLARLPGELRLHGYRPVPPEQLHLTLRFLGDDVDDARVPALEAALARVCAAVPAFDVDVRGAGAFSRRVVWAGVDGAGGTALADLAVRVESAVVALGVPPTDKPFRAHVTVARATRGRRGGGHVDAGGVGALGVLRVDAVTVFESRTLPGGAVHTVRARVPLGGGAPA